MLDSLEAHRIWTLPRGEDLPREHLATDGDGIYAEVRHNDCYRVYSYYAPESGSAPEHRDATALKRVLSDPRQQ